MDPSPSDDEANFDLFGDLSPDEQEQTSARHATMNKANDARLDQLQHSRISPEDRTIKANRWLFMHTRRHHRHDSSPDATLPCLIPQLLTQDECQTILDQLPGATSTEWTTARHSAFPTTDIPIATTPSLRYLMPLLQDRLVSSVLAPIYGFARHQLGFRDLFLVRYDSQAQQGLAPHTDGCLMSFSILINSPDDFEGGGTLFYTGSNTVMMRPTHQGDVVHHDACITHQGVNITRGERIILVGFVDTVDTIRQDQLGNGARKLRSE
ncbi:hypothetical protein [Absidia glauca]|uniref:Fe2OG dioxygenase domain-containing protein n=1 Tax=Absidia glauca TaxID=4829 RepID=A0A163JJQ1_ABSGL|nr:hypothetical protein [Absidia glauca]